MSVLQELAAHRTVKTRCIYLGASASLKIERTLEARLCHWIASQGRGRPTPRILYPKRELLLGRGCLSYPYCDAVLSKELFSTIKPHEPCCRRPSFLPTPGHTTKASIACLVTFDSLRKRFHRVFFISSLLKRCGHTAAIKGDFHPGTRCKAAFITPALLIPWSPGVLFVDRSHTTSCPQD